MKFTKTAVAVAIAGIAATPMIASADTTLSGVVQIKFTGTDEDGDAGDAKFDNGDVRLGLSTEHELDSGLTGYGNLRFDMERLSNEPDTYVLVDDDGDPILDADGNEQTQDIASSGQVDEVYVGVKGGFGDVRVGEIPLAVEYGQLANDIYDVGAEINGGLSYTGTFGPVSLLANFSPEPNSDAVGIGAKFGFGGFTIGLGVEDRAEAQNAAVGASGTFGGATVAAHFWTQENTGGGDDDESIAVQVGYGFGGVSAKVTFATLEGEGDDKETIRLDLGYGLGGGTEISTRINAESDNNDGDNDKTEWRIQLSKSF